MKFGKAAMVQGRAKTVRMVVTVFFLLLCGAVSVPVHPSTIQAAAPEKEKALVMKAAETAIEFAKESNCSPTAMAKLGRRECKDFTAACIMRAKISPPERAKGVQDRRCVRVDWMVRFEDTPFRKNSKYYVVTRTQGVYTVAESPGMCCGTK